MDVSFVIRQRLDEFGLDQRELARAAQVTESYISQLLTRKKAPPAPTPHRHLRQDGQVLEAAERGAGAAGGRPAEGGTEAGAGGGAAASVRRRSRVDPAEVSPGQGSARPRDLREAALRRARAARHPAAPGRAPGRGQAGTGERLLAPHGGGPRRPKLRGDARHRARVPRYGHLSPVPGALRLVPGSADRVLGHRPGDVCPGHQLERQGGLRSTRSDSSSSSGRPTSSSPKSPDSRSFSRTFHSAAPPPRRRSSSSSG